MLICLQSSISSRTRQIVYSIVTAENDLTKLRNIEELSSHIMTYPEAKNNAVKVTNHKNINWNVFMYVVFFRMVQFDYCCKLGKKRKI